MEPEAIQKRLETHAFFEGLAPEHLERLASAAEVCDLDPEEMLFRQDAPAERFYLVLDGEISVEVPALIGPPLTLQVLQADDVLGWSWLFPPYRWHFDARATRKSRALCFDATDVRALCERDHDFGYEIVKRFATLMKGRLESARLKVMETYGPTP